MPIEKMTRSKMIQALKLLAELAEKEHLYLELCIYGGSALMLAYDCRESSKDIDVIMRPRDKALRLAQKVAETLNLHEDWLNDDVKMYLGEKPALRQLVLDEVNSPFLTLSVPTAGYLLAMKALACRRVLPGFKGDIDDLSFLIKKMNIRSVEEIQIHIDKYFIDSPLPAATVAFLEDLLIKIWGNTQHA